MKNSNTATVTNYNFDKNRLERMIETYVEQGKNSDRMPYLQQMANRLIEAADVLAAYLIGTVTEYEKSLPCTKEQWDFFMSLMQGPRIASRFKYSHLQGRDKYATMARLAGWKARWPYMDNCQSSRIEPAEYWAWVWMTEEKGQNRFEELLKGHCPTGWGISSQGYGYHLAEGLILAAKEGLVKIPVEKQENALLAYAQWIVHKKGLGNADWTDFLHGIGAKIENLGSETLQKLAVLLAMSSSHLSSRLCKELGKRRESLHYPAMQDPKGWVEGYLEVTFTATTVRKDAKRFKSSTCELEKAFLFATHSESGVKKVANPSDPFGHRKPEFLVLIDWDGSYQYSTPSYEKCLEHMRVRTK